MIFLFLKHNNLKVFKIDNFWVIISVRENLKIGSERMSKTAIGSNWKDIRNDLFTQEEIAATDLRVAIISELIRARKELGISQKQLEELSGVKQPVIARIEVGKSIPQLDTLLKILGCLGKTLAIVPLSTSEVK